MSKKINQLFAYFMVELFTAIGIWIVLAVTQPFSAPFYVTLFWIIFALAATNLFMYFIIRGAASKWGRKV